jgi:LEA14-like dessication related protein
MKISGRLWKGLVIFIILTVIGLVVFYIFNPRKALKLIIPDLSAISRVNSLIKHDTVYLDFSMIFRNHNPYKLTIDTLHFEVKLNDTVIARQTTRLNIGQGRFDVDTTTLPLNLNVKHIRKLIEHLQSQDSTNAEISGFIDYRTIFGKTRLNFDKKMRIEVPVPPKIKVLKVERKQFSYRKKTLKAVAHIQIINKGKNINLELTNVHYDLRVKNTLRSTGYIASNVKILPHTSMIVDVPMEILVYHPLKTALLIRLDEDRLDYTLDLRCGIRENISDRSYTSHAEIKAEGKLELVK